MTFLLLAALNDEQRSNLVDHLGKMKDLQDFSAAAVDAAMNDAELKGFFENYGKAITVVQMADKIANAKDSEALQMIGGEAAKASLEYMAGKVPQLAGAVSALNFISCANTGLSLFKDFVFDPALDQAVLGDDVLNETLTFDVTGRAHWELTGIRANGSPARDSADESETGAVVIHVGLRK